MLGPGGLEAWIAEAETRVRERTHDETPQNVSVVDLTSTRAPDQDNDIIEWRDVDTNKSTSIPNDQSDHTTAHFTSALRRLTAPSINKVTRNTMAHSKEAVDARVTGVSRRQRLTRDKTAAALVVSSKREKERERMGNHMGKQSHKYDVLEGTTLMRITDGGTPLATIACTDYFYRDDTDLISRSFLSDASSPDASFIHDDSDDSDLETVTIKRTPRAASFPTTAKARNQHWSVAKPEPVALDDEENAFEKLYGRNFTQTQRLDVATRQRRYFLNSFDDAMRGDMLRIGDVADVHGSSALHPSLYTSATSTAIEDAKKKRTTRLKKVARENREVDAAARHAALVAKEREHRDSRKKKLAKGSGVTRSTAGTKTSSSAKTIVKTVSAKTSVSKRTATDRRVQTKSKQSALYLRPKKQKKKANTEKGNVPPEPLPDRVIKILDLAWNRHAAPPWGLEDSIGTEPALPETEENGVTDTSTDTTDTTTTTTCPQLVIKSKKPKPVSLLPFNPANADACARVGDAACSARLRRWCDFAGIPLRTETTNGHMAVLLKRAYYDALKRIEELVPGVSADVSSTVIHESKLRHQEMSVRRQKAGNASGKNTSSENTLKNVLLPVRNTKRWM